MRTMNKGNLMLSIFIIGSILLNIYLYTSNKSKGNVDIIDSLYIKNNELNKSIDSLENLITIEKSRYDSLIIKIDSSEDRYNYIEDKYSNLKDSIMYLNADESIIFLIKEAEL